MLAIRVFGMISVRSVDDDKVSEFVESLVMTMTSPERKGAQM